ncbi:MAG TPA: PH domain-containing protein [Longimicrobiales bacterium]|nr:PH domain-containing protein [Longimicrobiales bacterium]
MTQTSSERRLHPLSVLFSSARTLKSLLLPLVALMFAIRDNASLVFIVAMLAAVSALTGSAAVVRYLRFSYRYDERDMVIRSGLLTRQERRIPYVRIQNVDAAQNPVHRLLGVAAVYVQTGGGAEPEAALSVLPLEALEEMRARVLAAGGRAAASEAAGEASEEAGAASEEAGADGAVATARGELAAAAGEAAAGADDLPEAARALARRTLLELGPRELIVAGFIENRGMVLIAGAFALFEQTGGMERFIDRMMDAETGVLPGVFGRMPPIGDLPIVSGAFLVLAALLMLLLFVRLLSTVWAVVRLYDFRLVRTGDDLHTEYGLFTRVSATIPLRRIQTIIVRERLLHRWLGRRMVLVETAGGDAAAEGAPSREPIAPIIHDRHVPALLEELHRGLDLQAIDWRPVHGRAFGRMLRGSLFWPILLSLAAYFVIDEWALAVVVAVLAVCVMHARLRSRYLAWAFTSDSLVVRDGAFTRTTRVARFDRVQVASVTRSPIDIRTGMAHVRADTAGARGGTVVPFLAGAEADRMHDELVARAAATAFTW